MTFVGEACSDFDIEASQTIFMGKNAAKFVRIQLKRITDERMFKIMS